MLCIMNDIKVISFDLWGTLFDDSDYIRELEEKGLRHVLKYQKNIIFCKQIIGGDYLK